METQNTVSKKQKAWKIVSYIINILSILIMLLAIFIVITSLTSKDRGYPAYFGKAYVTVATDSMAQDVTKWDNFNPGDAIAFKLLSADEKKNLKIGDVITFWDNNIGSTRALNTHRIYDIQDVDGDGEMEYSTIGDHNDRQYNATVEHHNLGNFDKDSSDNQLWREASDVQGVYVGKSPFFGKILTYLQSKTGFAIFIVVPCVLVVIYCLTLVVLNLMRYSKEKAVMQREDDVDALKAELKAQLLKEMEEEKNSKGKKDGKTKDEAKEDKAKVEDKKEKSDDAKNKKQSKQKSEK